ncbi:RNA polymerase sigma factor FliA [Bordetella sp. 15P40C-2]|uniref:RNA polymerase sigma factor FliA n=1 Tax=Bordetella sp. 15P40C-2 TaxID=2572246 RepID=UPI001329B002|nr:RNA polymerase sigma factor FliA [Bordetella sp. 15P40C-2]MVW69946.1 FliA/WhiG family RNA polymerase sigma factor [Bordetella sp. 15P40C-2]
MTSPTEALIQEHAPLVRRLALKLATKLPANVELDDLIQSGMMGLLDAAKKYEKGRGAQFTSYAITRINGSMLDELRRQDWLPRSARARSRQIEAAMQSLEQELGRSATEQEIAEHLGINTEDFHSLLDEAQGIQLVHYEDLAGGHTDSSMAHGGMLDSLVSEDATPLDALLGGEFRHCLAQAIASLPEKEKLVLHLAYEQDLNFAEISEVLNLSRGRISQIKTQAVLRLRAALNEMHWTAMPEETALSLVC